jgi:UDP-2-acetamido-2-deoxy-ribo-hexuluronate aminotransferase
VSNAGSAVFSTLASTRVPFFSQALTFDRLWPRISANVEAVFDNGKFSHGASVAAFERELSRYTGAPYVVGVNSGTDALVLLLRAAGLRRGDAVAVPAMSFVASASSVVLAGGVPRFTDVDPRTYAMSADSLADVMHPDVRFAMPVHLFCQPADMAAITAVAARSGVTVVEDSAEAIGMRHAGVHAGLHGVGGVLSFFPSKTLGAVGDAGAVLTADPEIAERVAALRHHGRGGHTVDNFPGIANPVELSGLNSKMDDIQAAVLLAKLTRLEADIARRAELARAYDERLAGVPGIRTPQVVTRGPGDRAVYYVYLIEADRRDELAAFLAAQGIGTEVYYPRPLHLQPCFAALGHREGEFPHAEAACRRALALPLYPDLRLEQLERVCAAIRDFSAGGRG